MANDNEAEGRRDERRSSLNKMVQRWYKESNEVDMDEPLNQVEPRAAQMGRDQQSSSSLDQVQSNYQLQRGESLQGGVTPQPVPTQPIWQPDTWSQQPPQYPVSISSMGIQFPLQTIPLEQQHNDALSSATTEHPGKSQHYRERRVDRALDLIKARYRLITYETNSRFLIDTYNGEVLPLIPDAIIEPIATSYRAHHQTEVQKSDIKNAFEHFLQLTQPFQETFFFGRAGYDSLTKERYIVAGQGCLIFRANTPMYEAYFYKPHVIPTQSLPLNLPSNAGNIHLQLIDTLFASTVLPKESDLLVIAWMILTWMPDRAQLMLELIGTPSSSLEQTQTTLKSVVDPATVTLLNEIPSNVKRFNELAHQQYLLSFNQVETLTNTQQDHLYSLLRGKHLPWSWKNKKTGAEIRVHCPIVFNSLGNVDTKTKLADVTLSIEINDDNILEYYPEEAAGIQQTILQGLLLIFGGVQAQWQYVEYQSRFEHHGGLKDFCRIGELVAKTLERDPAEFWQQFEASQQSRREFELEESPVAIAMKRCLEAEPEGVIEATVKDWLEHLKVYRPAHDPTGAWPVSARGLAAKFQQSRPLLEAFGIHLHRLERRGPNGRWRASLVAETAPN